MRFAHSPLRDEPPHLTSPRERGEGYLEAGQVAYLVWLDHAAEDAAAVRGLEEDD